MADGCLGRKRKDKKKKNRGDASDCGCDGLDCCSFQLWTQVHMLGAVVCAVLGVGRTVRAINAEAAGRVGAAPRGFLARRMHTAVRYYQLRISPRYGARCRYTPTCSAYAATALRRHGALRGGLLTLRRLARCTPNGGRGADPVPGM
jgi:putative membrane protein insertion efficiency factor